MNGHSRWVGVFAVVCAFAPPVAAAQAYWSARQLLQQTTAPVVSLRKGVQVVDTVRRSSVQRSMNVITRIAASYGMNEPEVVLQASKSPNAFATMRGGRPLVGINTEMLRMAGDDEDELAVVMGHELGHLQAHHTTDGARRAAAVTLLGAVLGALVDINQAKHGRNTGGAGTALGGIGANLVNAKFSRDQEREADRLGIQAMARAGYNPEAAPAMWRKMQERGGGGSGLWMSTHPSHAEREGELTALAREVEPVYLANRSGPRSPSELPQQNEVASAPSADATTNKPTAIAANSPPADASGLTTADRPAPPPAMSAAAAPGIPDAAAFGLLSLNYLLGQCGVEKDYQRARTYSERAMEGGDELGKAVFGTLLRDGIAGSRDPGRAVALLTSAARAGVPWAHYQLGVALEQGVGISADRAAAAAEYERAAGTIPGALERLKLLSK